MDFLWRNQPDLETASEQRKYPGIFQREMAHVLGTEKRVLGHYGRFQTSGVITDRINLCFQLFWFSGDVLESVFPAVLVFFLVMFWACRIFLRCLLQLFGEMYVPLSLVIKFTCVMSTKKSKTPIRGEKIGRYMFSTLHFCYISVQYYLHSVV